MDKKEVAKKKLKTLYMGPNAPFRHPEDVMWSFLNSTEGRELMAVRILGQDEVRGYSEVNDEIAEAVIRWISVNFE